LIEIDRQITDEGATGLTLLVTNNLKNLQSLNLEFTGYGMNNNTGEILKFAG